MTRIFLTSYLMIATLAGPWICCCTTARLAHQFSTALAQPATPPFHRGCCGCNSARGEHRPSPGESQDQGKSPLGGDCPCHSNQSRTAVALLSDSDTWRLQNWESCRKMFTGLSLTADARVSSVAEHPLTLHENAALPFPACSDILRAFHILRC